MYEICDKGLCLSLYHQVFKKKGTVWHHKACSMITASVSQTYLSHFIFLGKESGKARNKRSEE